MDMIVVLKFSKWQQIMPVILPFIDKHPEVLVQFLIDPFCLAVGLGVPSSSRRYFDSKKSVKLLCESGYKLRASVRDNLFREPVVFPDMVHEEPSQAFGREGSVCWDDVHSLGQGFHNSHDCIIASRLRQFHYKVNTDGVPAFGRDG